MPLVDAVNVGLKEGPDCENSDVDVELSFVVVEAAKRGFGGEEIGVVENKAGLSESGVDGLAEDVTD